MAPSENGRQRVVGIVGMGYVGLPLAVAFAQAGDGVIGVDISAERIAQLERGSSPVEDIGDDTLAAVRANIEFTTRYATLARADALIICVPTPLTGNREPDLGPLEDAVTRIAEIAQSGQLVVLESTTYPGTTREILAPALERAGLKVGTDVFVAFSPERVDPGRTDFTLRTTPKVVGGMTADCLERAVQLYSDVCDEIVQVSSPDAAELTKLLENIFRSVNIALVNELTILCDRMGIDIREVVQAAATKPYGFMRFDPGPGMGGHCLPVDPFYLAWRAREFDLSVEFIELAGKVNQQMPYYCVERIERALNDVGKAVRGSRIALLGMSYKPNIGDIRESPALKIAAVLQGLGGDVVYHDEHVPEVASLGLSNEPLDAALDDADLVVVVTAHAGVDHAALAGRVPLLLDLRGVVPAGSENLIRL
jgi:UDP-N-acetyl-D-glucosamine dehydrogenase